MDQAPDTMDLLNKLAIRRASDVEKHTLNRVWIEHPSKMGFGVATCHMIS